ncbi:MAG: GntR family transcriptional regulator [Ruthenibacterium sp.]
MGKQIASSVQEMVYQSLRKDIMRLVLKPGTVMSAQDVSVRLKVSRTPVREAFIRLSKEGLVDIEAQKGTTVSLIDMKRVKQERFVRETLEVANLKLFLGHVTPQIISEMRAEIVQQTDALARKDYTSFMQQDNDFHQNFFTVSKRTLCGEIIGEMSGHYDRIRMITTWKEGLPEGAIKQHCELLNFLEASDLEGATQVLTRHLHKLLIEEKKLVKQWPDFFLDAEDSEYD